MKNLLIILFLLIGTQAVSQASFGIYQDTRLFALGDNGNNPRGTMDIVTNMHLKSPLWGGKFVLNAEVEGADLNPDYFLRYALGGGLEYKLLLGVDGGINAIGGLIYRGRNAYWSNGINTYLNVKLFGDVYGSAMLQTLDRRDLTRYHDHWTGRIKYSGFVGLRFEL